MATCLSEQGVRCRWLHDGLDTNEREETLKALHDGEFDVLVGISLLPRASTSPRSVGGHFGCRQARLLRSETGLVQMMAARRNANAKAILYAETVTGAMTAPSWKHGAGVNTRRNITGGMGLCRARS